MTKLVNRAKMTTATTGTGTITLGSAVDGYQTFAAAGVANADVVRYVIEDGDAWEIGLGTYSAGTLTRGSIESSNADNALNLTGNAVVFVSAAAADLQELVDFADNFVLPTADGSTGQVLTTNGAGTLTFTTITGYSDADVDTHLNTSTATTGEVLSWNGTDYDWIAAPAALTGQTDSASPFETSLGSGAGAVNTGVNNTFIGFEAGNANTTGQQNTTLGFRTLLLSTTANFNTAIGANAGAALTGGNNTALGANALSTATTGRFNIAVGDGAMGSGNATNTTGYNTAVGYRAGYVLTTGAENFLAGREVGLALTSGSNNVAIGSVAFKAATTGGRNVAIGIEAMGSGIATNTTGNNVAIGDRAGFLITSGSNNVALGRRPLDAATTASDNVALGNEALGALTTGSNNVAIGNGALDAATTGGRNVAIGQNAMGTGVATSAFGLNVAVGDASLENVTSGVRNVALGPFAGSNVTTGSFNTLLGNNAQPSSATVDHEITLGNSSVTALRCQVTTITSLSDARDKTDIQPLNAGLEFVEALNPVSFTWNMRDGGKVGEADTGFIAQDLQTAQADTGVTIPGLVFDVNPDKLEAGYGKLIPVLVQAIKDLSEKVKDLESKLEAQN